MADGAAKTVRHLAALRAASGASVAVFAAGDGPADAIPGCAVHQFRRGHPGAVALPPGLEVALRLFRPDIVHLHGATVPWCLRLADRLAATGIPYAVSLHGNLAAPLIARAPCRKALHHILQIRPTLNAAAFLHSVGDGADARAAGLHAPIVEARNGVRLPDPDPAREAARRRWRDRLGPGRHLLALGRLDIHHKGLDLLVAAWAAVRRGPGLLVIAGPGGAAARVRLAEAAARAGVPGAILMPGPVHGAERDGLLAAVDAVVQASRWEAGLCHTVLEAAAFARPLLVTEPVDRSGHLRACGAGLVVPATVAGLTAGLAALAAATPAELDMLGDRARCLVRRAYRWPETDARLAEAYARAVMGRAPGEGEVEAVALSASDGVGAGPAAGDVGLAGARPTYGSW
ncbi:MAG: glycosyltransferase [Azospirillaceae bacterium]